MMKVSVALPTFNGSRFLIPQLESLADQLRRPDEVVVSDDGSTDDTIDMVKEFQRKAPFDVSLIQNPGSRGVVGNISAALRSCRGDFILLCDQDDIWTSHHVSILSSELQGRNKSMAFGDLRLFTEKQGYSSRTQFRRLGVDSALLGNLKHAPMDVLLRRNVVTGCASGITNDLLSIALPIPQFWLHDEWFAVVAAVVGQLCPITQVVTHYRQHLNQQVGGAPSTFLKGISPAVKMMEVNYLTRQSLKSESAAQAFEYRLGGSLGASVAEVFRERKEHYLRRAEGNFAIDISMVLDGQYERFGYGWRAFAVDMVNFLTTADSRALTD